MSTTPVVFRHYEASSTSCEKAVELLLKGTVDKKKAAHPGRPNDAKKGSLKHEVRAKASIHQ